ncbi:MAG TPA: EVE domain-containing protein [Acidobacteriaceae bacterium]|jgi:predicted RNA-binding protein with PUA-like domain|nr:EVE domain-containing protein [Acidobacteriaceae bacterium]
MPFLLKTESSVYSFADLQRDHETIWDGVTNPQAVKNLREMKPKEALIIYHTGDIRTAVGTAVVASVDTTNPKVPLVRIRCGKPLTDPKTLADMKDAPLFADSPLLRQGRLSVVPLTEKQYAWILSAR